MYYFFTMHKFNKTKVHFNGYILRKLYGVMRVVRWRHSTVLSGMYRVGDVTTVFSHACRHSPVADPATRFDLAVSDMPEVELPFDDGSTHVEWDMQLACGYILRFNMI